MVHSNSDVLFRNTDLMYFKMHPVPPLRPASGDELHPEVHAASFSHHPTGSFHGHHLLHYGIGAIQVQNAQDLLLHRHKYIMHHNRVTFGSNPIDALISLVDQYWGHYTTKVISYRAV